MAELYLFRQTTTYYPFSPTILAKTFNGKEYAPTTITRTTIKISDNTNKNTVTFSFPKNHSFAKDLLNFLPEKEVTLEVFKDGLLYWSGVFVHAFSEPKTIKLVFDSTMSSLTRAGLRDTITPTCRHTLYNAQCRVIQSLYKDEYLNITANSTVVSVITGKADGFYGAGIAVLGGQTRHILTNNSTTITLIQPFSGVVSGTLALYRGCNLTEEVCLATFNNLDNFGGFARIPIKEPFGRTGLI